MGKDNRISRSPFGYTEEEMAQAFQHLLLSENGLPGVGCFGAIYREISCRQGRPDFIALRYNSPDPIIGVFRYIRKGRKARALSPTQQIYTLSQKAKRFE